MLATIWEDENETSEQDIQGICLQWRAIERAALLAYAGREAEAEVVRYAASYHNLETRLDADRV